MHAQQLFSTAGISGAFKSMEILNEEHQSLLSGTHWSKMIHKGRHRFCCGILISKIIIAQSLL